MDLTSLYPFFEFISLVAAAFLASNMSAIPCACVCACVCVFLLFFSCHKRQRHPRIGSLGSLSISADVRSFVLLSIRAEDERGLWRFYFRGSWLVVEKLILPGDSGDNVALATFNYSEPPHPTPPVCTRKWLRERDSARDSQRRWSSAIYKRISPARRRNCSCVTNVKQTWNDK